MLLIILALDEFKRASKPIRSPHYAEDLGEAANSQLVLRGDVILCRWICLFEISMLCKKLLVLVL